MELTSYWTVMFLVLEGTGWTFIAVLGQSGRPTSLSSIGKERDWCENIRTRRREVRDAKLRFDGEFSWVVIKFLT